MVVHLCNCKLIKHAESRISKANVVGLEVLWPFSSPVLYNITGEQVVKPEIDLSKPYRILVVEWSYKKEGINLIQAFIHSSIHPFFISCVHSFNKHQLNAHYVVDTRDVMVSKTRYGPWLMITILRIQWKVEKY